ncbi:MAG: glycosyltransferase family 2 protein [Deltaproteobacteria bacterium]|nr:glycosyltransferase family 2 protein [Deltaproteobacteria bacterium]
MPKISIVVPARNEANRIVNLLHSIKRQKYENFEVIVVDDNSEDSTVDVVKSFQSSLKDLRIVSSSYKNGWCGKNLALVTGFNEVSVDSRWVLFVDADCELKENALITVADFAERNSIDCLSLFPEIRSQRFFERLLLPTVGAVVTLFNSPKRVNRHELSDAFLNGQFIFIKKEVYRDIGTHEVVKDAVLEDAALAKEIKKRGYKIFLGFGEDIFLIRMYETFKEFMEGWTKNLYLIIGKDFKNLVKLILMLMVLSYMPIVWLIYGVVLLPNKVALAFISAYLLVLFFQMYLRLRSNTYPLYSVFAFVSSTIVAGIAIRSACKYILKRGVYWKGRKYFSDR